jgi:ParB family chromosome partitioning protein
MNDMDIIKVNTAPLVVEPSDIGAVPGTLGSADEMQKTRAYLSEWTQDKLEKVGISGPLFMVEALEILCTSRSADERRKALRQAEGFAAGAKNRKQVKELEEALARIRLELPEPECRSAARHAKEAESSQPESLPAITAAPAPGESPAEVVAVDPGAATVETQTPVAPIGGDDDLRNTCSATSITWVDPKDLHTSEPFSSLFEVRQDMIAKIAGDMRVNGFDPARSIVRWKARDVIVEGHTRKLSAEAASLGRVPVFDRDFANEDEAVEYAVKSQVNRRNLTEAEIMRCVEELDKRRGPANQHTAVRNVADSEQDRRKRSSAAATAATLDISLRKAEQARTVIAHATPKVKAAVESGKLSINAAYNATQEERGAVEPKAQLAKASARIATGNTAAAAIGEEVAQAVLPQVSAEGAAISDSSSEPTNEYLVRLMAGMLSCGCGEFVAPIQAVFMTEFTNVLKRDYPTFFERVKYIFEPAYLKKLVAACDSRARAGTGAGRA